MLSETWWELEEVSPDAGFGSLRPWPLRVCGIFVSFPLLLLLCLLATFLIAVPDKKQINVKEFILACSPKRVYHVGEVHQRAAGWVTGGIK